MKNYFRGKIVTYDDVLNDLKTLFSFAYKGVVQNEREHVLNYLENLDDEEKKQYICKNIVDFNKRLNVGGYSTSSLQNILCYIGYIGLIENYFSVIQELNTEEIALLSNHVCMFVTHPDYPENIFMPFLSEKSILSSIVSRKPNSISSQDCLLTDAREKFFNMGNYNENEVVPYITSLSNEEILEINREICNETMKGMYQ